MEIPAKIKSLMERSKLVYVGTSDRSGKVHLSVAEAMSVPDRGHIAFEEWFCKKTLENLRENPGITVGVVDPQTGKGYQLIGELEDVDVGAMMNGFSVNKEEEWRRYPQSAHRLYIRTDSILELNTGPHSDEETG
jgi:predicted pyridoxine 5'-phosphate oxidase superfamily flavin-nucleotide-binding protein